MTISMLLVVSRPLFSLKFDIPLPASRKLQSGKYCALKILAAKELQLKNNLQVCFARRAWLKASRPLNPSPLIWLLTHNVSHLVQWIIHRIFLLLDHQNLAIMPWSMTLRDVFGMSITTPLLICHIVLACRPHTIVIPVPNIFHKEHKKEKKKKRGEMKHKNKLGNDKQYMN